ncbi:alpha carbonic anhydrase [Podospora australis]|uniref:carbonic anhydrase n=1 Tax=Podospora australis TaxID=1536484 RepID=A0AAN6WPP3_9PEZI|nr:alpha carbonic anhydrase [Podospora australis]
MARLLQALFLTASAGRALASCAYGTFLHPRAEGEEVPVATFGYTGVIGPHNWAALELPTNNACATGTRQSPIDMVANVFEVIPASDVTIEVNDMPDGADFENLGSTVEVITQGGTLAFDGKTFELQQFHFHLPSEHLDNGTSQAMEMHMVWQSAAAEIAVVGLYINIATGEVTTNITAPATKREITSRSRLFGKRQAQAPVAGATGPTTLLETIFSVVDQISTPGTKVKTPPLVMSEVVDLIKAGSFQAYSGSLTTPPCSEGVNWRVSTQKLSISPASFVKARDVIGFNSRFPQNTPGQPNILMVSALGSAAAAVSLSSTPAKAA